MRADLGIGEDPVRRPTPAGGRKSELSRFQANDDDRRAHLLAVGMFRIGGVKGRLLDLVGAENVPRFVDETNASPPRRPIERGEVEDRPQRGGRRQERRPQSSPCAGTRKDHQPFPSKAVAALVDELLERLLVIRIRGPVLVLVLLGDDQPLTDRDARG